MPISSAPVSYFVYKVKLDFKNNPISECHIDKSRQCIVTQDRNYFGPGSVDQFDALVIDVRFFLNAKETSEMIPKKRQPFQRYVFHTHEVRRIKVSKQLLLSKLFCVPGSKKIQVSFLQSQAFRNELFQLDNELQT